MKTLNKEQYLKVLKNNCQKGKHRLRENQFGVVFCTIYGLLSTSVGNVEKLMKEDKIEINNCLNILGSSFNG